jgi:hypothetical protein
VVIDEEDLHHTTSLPRPCRSDMVKGPETEGNVGPGQRRESRPAWRA